MLTYNDVTVPQAAEVFAKCEHTRARYWGFKEAGLPFAEMRDLFARMKACGKQTCLEVVAYTEAECLRGAEMAAACGCDFLLGTVFSEAVNAYCRATVAVHALCGAGDGAALGAGRHGGRDGL